VEDLVHVDRLGFPAQRMAGPLARVLVLGVPETARQRLLAAGVGELAERPEDAGGVDAVLVSTRLRRADLPGIMAPLRAPGVAPVVVLAHAGGEALAVEIMRQGAVGVVAEGNEAALGSFLSGEGHDTTLLETYDRQVPDGGGASEVDRDVVTGLPGSAALEARLAELAQSGDVPRIGCARILHLDETARRLSPAATALLRRRLGARYRELARSYGVELFTVSQSEFALVGEALSPHGAEALGRWMAQATETFAPSGSRTLALALGHAGSELTAELATLRELAQRALVVAAAAGRSSVVGAESLALGVSSTTELEAATRLVAHVEQHDGHAPGHGARTAAAAAAIARELGFEGPARTRVRLAAHLHDIGKIGLPVAALSGAPDAGEEAGWAYRLHPVRGADYLRVSAGPEVADAVRAHHERWDGAGFPDGLAGEDIPLAARVVALANRFDALRHGGAGGPGLPLEAALDALRADAGTLLDPELVKLALPLLAQTGSEA
jgi:HD-GYP domain-containing protein (c-di-GMP phosphodiesterase class II)